MDINFFIFSEEDFKFSKLHDNEARQDKRNFKKDFTVTFEVKNIA